MTKEELIANIANWHWESACAYASIHKDLNTKEEQNYRFTPEQKKKIKDTITSMKNCHALSLVGITTTDQVKKIVDILKKDFFYTSIKSLIKEYETRDTKHYQNDVNAYNAALDRISEIGMKLATNSKVDQENLTKAKNHINALRGLLAKPLTEKEIKKHTRQLIKEDLMEVGLSCTSADTLSKEIQEILFPPNF